MVDQPFHPREGVEQKIHDRPEQRLVNVIANHRSEGGEDQRDGPTETAIDCDVGLSFFHVI